METPTTPADVPKFLMESVSALRDSPEFQRLDEVSWLVPGLVLGQLTILLRRLQSEVINGQNAAPAVQDQLREIFLAFEVLARSPSRELQNLVVVEVLEHLHGPPDVRRAILASLGRSTRELYIKWVDPDFETA